MKSAALFFFLFLCTFNIAAQKRTVDDIANQREIPKAVYRLTTGAVDALVINMTYGQHEVVSETDRKKLADAQVIAVDLVFTDFPKGQDLKALNKTRIEKIYSLRKDLVTNPDVQWKIIRQTSCNNEAEAQVLFHGIVIHYRPKQDEKTIAADLKKLGDLPSTGDSLKKLVSRTVPYGVKLADSTVLKILDRHKEWTNMVIVADLSGSMSPYATQLLVWFQLRMKDKAVKQVVFFNDGDMKDESAKVVGSIGGIYKVKTMSYEEILATAVKTISNGSGGDAPENNCEAILRGIEAAPEAKEIILIADNLANIKDISLMKDIKKPVRIILCGTELAPINADYLNLARATGGSVHTMRDDLTTLTKGNEGETVKIAGSTFKIVGGAFVRVVTM